MKYTVRGVRDGIGGGKKNLMDDRMLEILTSRMLLDQFKCKACALPTELNARHTPFLYKVHGPASSVNHPTCTHGSI